MTDDPATEPHASAPPAGAKPIPILGGIAALAVWSLLPEILSGLPPDGMSAAAWRAAGVALLMAFWWVGEAMPLQVTGLVPLVAFPLLDIAAIGPTAASYANPLIFLFLGGFLLAAALERWGLHRRIAFGILGLVGSRPKAIVLGFMLATGFLSMWISNTATAMLMLPIATSVIGLVHQGSVGELPPAADRNFATALMLGVAYGASIGGAATLIGTPPNALMAAYLSREHGIQIGFSVWLAFALPVSLLLMAIAWQLLTRLVFPVARGRVPGVNRLLGLARQEIGSMSGSEKRVAAVFGTVALLWIARPLLEGLFPWLSLSDPAIAAAGAIALFVVPAAGQERRPLLVWEEAAKVPWGILLMLGGGIALSGGITETGLASWIGDRLLAIRDWPLLLIVLAIAGVVLLLTELTSNTATAAVFLPLAGGFAVAAGLPPAMLAAPVALAASCAFMMPVATPPNAIVYSSGYVTIGQMVRAGVFMNLIGVAAISLAAMLLVPLLFG